MKHKKRVLALLLAFSLAATPEIAQAAETGITAAPEELLAEEAEESIAEPHMEEDLVPEEDTVEEPVVLE